MFVLVGYQPVENALTGALTPPHLRYSAYGAKCAASFGVGALAVYFAGGVQQSFGIAGVLPAAGLVGLPAGLMVLVLILVTNRYYGSGKGYKS